MGRILLLYLSRLFRLQYATISSLKRLFFLILAAKILKVFLYSENLNNVVRQFLRIGCLDLRLKAGSCVPRQIWCENKEATKGSFTPNVVLLASYRFNKHTRSYVSGGALSVDKYCTDAIVEVLINIALMNCLLINISSLDGQLSSSPCFTWNASADSAIVFYSNSVVVMISKKLLYIVI